VNGAPSAVPSALALILAFAATACGDPIRSAGPTPGPSAAVAAQSQPFEQVVVARSSPTPSGPAVVARVTPEGGTIVLSGAGLRITFPAGAVAEPVDVTVKIASTSRVAYEFEPHGLVFARAVIVEQALAGTSAAADALLRRNLVATYVAGRFDDRVDGIVVADELLPVRLDGERMVASFSIAHFSGYQLASGRHGGR
jgi:hypothetical protein